MMMMIIVMTSFLSLRALIDAQFDSALKRKLTVRA